MVDYGSAGDGDTEPRSERTRLHLDGQGPAISECQEAGKNDAPAGFAGRRGLLSISVIDDGPGMDAQTLIQATEPFSRQKGVGKRYGAWF